MKKPSVHVCHELLLDGFGELAREIKGQGVDPDTASHYAALIGDTPVHDEHGNVLVMDGDKIVATLKPLKFFTAG